MRSIKSVVALAALAAMSGAAMAADNVQIYGNLDTAAGQVTSDSDALGKVSGTKMTGAGLSESYLGFKGGEDLGGGLKLSFKLESGVDLGKGNGEMFARESTLGVQGDFGTLKVGKQATVYDAHRDAAESVWHAEFGPSKFVWSGYTDRTESTVSYSSPVVNGFSGQASYDVTDEGFALGVQYDGGPLKVGFAHQTEHGVYSMVDGAAKGLAFVSDAGPLQAPGIDGDTSYNLLHGSYDLGPVALNAAFNQAEFEGDGGLGKAESKEYQLGVTVPVSARLAVSAGYAHAERTGDFGDATSEGVSVGVKYELSKRSQVYGALSHSKTDFGNGSNARLNLVGVGLKHAF